MTKYVTLGPEQMGALLAELEAEQIRVAIEPDREASTASWGITLGGTGFLTALIVAIRLLRLGEKLTQTNVRLAKVEAELEKLGADRP